MRPLTARAPTFADLAMAVLWPNLLLAALIAIGMFDLVLLAAIIWADDATVEDALGVGAGLGLLICIVPILAAILIDVVFLLRERGASRRADWLGRIASVARLNASALRFTAATGAGLIVAAMFARPFATGAVAVVVIALVAIPFANLALHAGARRMRVIAARARRLARDHCRQCDYIIAGLTRCPECGHLVAPRRQPAPSPSIHTIRV